VEFIDKYRDELVGVEPICAVIGAAPSTYHAATNRPPSARQLRDEWLKAEMLRVYNAKFQVYGARKVWRQLRREDITVARCTVEQLMEALGIAGVVRGRRRRTTIADPANPAPPDLLQRDFTAPAPNTRWVTDFTEVSTYAGTVYAAFIIDCYSPLHRRVAAGRPHAHRPAARRPRDGPTPTTNPQGTDRPPLRPWIADRTQPVVATPAC
jgi:putative transposase